MKINALLTKKPFVRITPEGYLKGRITTDAHKACAVDNRAFWQVVTQADFLREYYPTGHKINSELFYPNRIKYDEQQQRFFEEKVFRASFPLQMVITVQQLVHLCGNDIRFELTEGRTSETANSLLSEIRQGWLERNMEVAFYDFARSVKITGDGATVFYMRDGKVRTRCLSFLNGDTLYPHFDPESGELTAFARRFFDYTEDGQERTEWVEVWDKEFLYRYRKARQGLAGTVASLSEMFGLDGYTADGKPEKHNFRGVPVVYRRDPDGPCWSFSQDNIDKYELAISHLCQNNMAYAFPIMLLKGEDVEIQGDMYGAVKAITMGSDDDASFMSRPEASSAFELQLNTLLKMIFMGSFTVMPPEVKSGDLPGVAIKLIYSPSVEKAMTDCKDFDSSIDRMRELFLEGYGIERGKSTQYAQLPLTAWAEPYIHQNTAELVNNLVQAVNSGILSKRTGSELSTYGRNDEWDRLLSEYKRKQEADLLYTLRTQQDTADTPGTDAEDGTAEDDGGEVKDEKGGEE